MKIRSDYVTNSSSSSFIISKDLVSLDKLFEILIEMAKKDAYYYDDEDDEPYVSREEMCVNNYNIIEATPETPYVYDEYEGFFSTKVSESKRYDNHYVIDNDCTCRYNWNVVQSVLDKYNIPHIPGYCD